MYICKQNKSPRNYVEGVVVHVFNLVAQQHLTWMQTVQ